MGHILEQISISPPIASQTSLNNPGFLSGLQTLEIVGECSTGWAFIPSIFDWPQRNSLSLMIKMRDITISDEVSDGLGQLVALYKGS